MKNNKFLTATFALVMGLSTLASTSHALGLVILLPVLASLGTTATIDAKEDDKAQLFLARGDAKAFVLEQGPMTDALRDVIANLRTLAKAQGINLDNVSTQEMALNVYLAQ